MFTSVKTRLLEQHRERERAAQAVMDHPLFIERAEVRELAESCAPPEFVEGFIRLLLAGKVRHLGHQVVVVEELPLTPGKQKALADGFVKALGQMVR